MLRGAPQASAQDNSKQQQQQQQRQKKRLSFKDPEVESPLRNYLNAGCRSKTLLRTTTTKPTTSFRKASASVEDLTLEDQALQIAQNVGSAFSDLSITDNELVDFPELESISTGTNLQETEILDSSPTAFEPYQQQNYQFESFEISAEDQEFLNALGPPAVDETMRGPAVKSNDTNPSKNCIPSLQRDIRPSSSAQHQVQLLKYQLEQQNQQTQMLLHQVKLLQDQMEAENMARRKAQEQNNQLMEQNKELLSHMEKLFQQIEELERHILMLEQENMPKRRVIPKQDHQVTSLRQPTSYATGRRPSSEQASEKTAVQNRSQYGTARKSSLTLTKPLATTPKPSMQNAAAVPANRKTTSIYSRSYGIQNKSKESGAKEKETLRVGDSSPTVQSGMTSPFSSNWKLKAPDASSNLSNTDKSSTSSVRSRTGSFSSYTKKPQADTEKSTLFGSANSSLSSTSITGKKYSSSTSDLYNTPSTFQEKSSLMIDEPGVKSAISNLSINAISRLPRYQPFTGWQRRTSLSGENEPVSAVGKDSYKSPTKTFLFNR